MKMKMNRNQLEAVGLILRVMLENNPPMNPAERLVYGFVYKLFARIRTRCERIDSTKNGWGLSLSEQEALALYVFIQNMVIPEGYDYERIQINSIFNQIDKEYGGHTHQDKGCRRLVAQ